MRIHKAMASGMSVLMLLFSFALASNPALAQPPAASIAAPRIDGFHVGVAQRLTAGNTLAFTLHGTPGGTASASIAGAAQGKIAFDEVEPGLYEGTYTIRNGDRIAAHAPVTVNLRVGNQIATEILDEPLLANAPVARPAMSATGTPVPAIESFVVAPPARLAPGEQLFFTLRGTPGGKASVRIAGLNGKILLEEAQPNSYEGAYTIKSRDHIAPNAVATATLSLGNRDVTAKLNGPLLAASAATQAAHHPARICAHCGVVAAVNPVSVKGNGSLLGKIGGGVVGGLLGSELGGHRNSTVTGIAGAVGGAFLGNEIEKRVKTTKHYEVVVHLQGGGTQTITYTSPPPFAVGQKVRVENGTLVAN